MSNQNQPSDVSNTTHFNANTPKTSRIGVSTLSSTSTPAVDTDAEVALEQPEVRRELIAIIVEHLREEGYGTAATVLEEEAGLKDQEANGRRKHLQRMEAAIADGDWVEVERLCQKRAFRTQKSFLYAVHKQQYLELIDSGEYQKAFTVLQKRLKPLESMEAAPGEFQQLCYLLTCRSVHDAPAFRHWDSILPNSRDALLRELRSVVTVDPQSHPSRPSVPPHRLMDLLRQAVTFQVRRTQQHPRLRPKICTLLRDYSSFVLPNAERHRLIGHQQNVKALSFVGRDGRWLASGGSDRSVRLWDVASGQCRAVLSGHTSRIWQLAAARGGNLLASASGDGTVRVWDMPWAELMDSRNDRWGSHVYRRQRHGHGHRYRGRRDNGINDSQDNNNNDHNQIKDNNNNNNSNNNNQNNSSCDNNDNTNNEEEEEEPDRDDDDDGGGTAGLVDIDACRTILGGHGGDVYGVAFHPSDQHVATGSYDATVRLFDLSTGALVRAFKGHAGPVCTVGFNPHGNVLVSGSKDNSIKLWDMVSGVCIHTFSQHLGEVTSVSIDASASALLSCSKDNSNRLWDLRMRRPVTRYKGHQNTYKNLVRAGFGPNDGVILGGSEDGQGYIWERETGRVVQRLPGHVGTVYQTTWSPAHGLMATCGDDAVIRTWHYDSSMPPLI